MYSVTVRQCCPQLCCITSLTTAAVMFVLAWVVLTDTNLFGQSLFRQRGHACTSPVAVNLLWCFLIPALNLPAVEFCLDRVFLVGLVPCMHLKLVLATECLECLATHVVTVWK